MGELTKQERDRLMTNAVNAMAQLTFLERTEVLTQVGQILKAKGEELRKTEGDTE
jgi:hypothetical protein